MRAALRAAALIGASVAAIGTALPVQARQAAPAPDRDERLKLARTIVEQTMPPAQRDAMFAQMIDGIMANMLSGMMNADPRLAKVVEARPKVGTVFAAFVTRQKQLVLADMSEAAPAMVEALAGAHASRFSLPELTQVDAFVRTPTGSRFIQSGMSIFSDPGVAAWHRDFAERTQRRQKEELSRFIAELQPILEEYDVEPSKS